MKQFQTHRSDSKSHDILVPSTEQSLVVAFRMEREKASEEKKQEYTKWVAEECTQLEQSMHVNNNFQKIATLSPFILLSAHISMNNKQSLLGDLNGWFGSCKRLDAMICSCLKLIISQFVY